MKPLVSWWSLLYPINDPILLCEEQYQISRWEDVDGTVWHYRKYDDGNGGRKYQKQKMGDDNWEPCEEPKEL